MRAVKRRELDGVSNEEDGNVVADKVLVSFVSVDLHAPAVDIASGIGGASLGANS